MKEVIYIYLISVLACFTCQAQVNEETAIKETIIAFSNAGDTNNAETMAQYLDPNYRIIMNQLFGSTAVSILSRATYLDKIKSKEFGGDNRTVDVKHLTINGNTAFVLVKFTGSKMTSSNIILLVKDKTGHWLLISDTPVIG
jgi:hypothetical protein